MKRNETFLIRAVGNESVLIPLGAQVGTMNGMVILNDTAQCLWELLRDDRSLDELAAAVAERFEVEPERARADVQRFLDEAAKIGMIET